MNEFSSTSFKFKETLNLADESQISQNWTTGLEISYIITYVKTMSYLALRSSSKAFPSNYLLYSSVENIKTI